MRTFFLFFLILGLSGAVYGQSEAITNKISRALKGTMYTEQASTVKYAKANHSGQVLNCAQYSYRIKDIAKKTGKEAEVWQVGGKHAIVIVKDGCKRIAYSNGKVVRESAYSKLKRLE